MNTSVNFSDLIKGQSFARLAGNMLFNTDSYKVSMHAQYPEGTSGVYSYIEARGGIFDETVFFGLQAFLKEYMCRPITQQDINIAEVFYALHGEPFNKAGWEYILREHGGRLPLVIRSVPEGTVVPVKHVLLTIEATDKNVPWLTTWAETSILCGVWYGTTVATLAYNIRKTITKYLELTGDPEDMLTIEYRLQDFGSRGVSSLESSGIGGSGHLLSFKGSDNIAGILAAAVYYNAGVCGVSIPAAEHSTITSWGRENEVEAYRNMLKQFGRPGSVLAVVSDSYNIYNACENLWGGELRQEVIDSGATVVIRPDSGDPEEVCVKVIKLLDAKFGHVVNTKGYKVLNTVRIIQGDGVNEQMIERILGHYAMLGYAATNISFGMGGALLQGVNRDTQAWAMKCSAMERNNDGIWFNVQKDPITSSAKKSKAGRVMLYTNGTGEYVSGIEGETPKQWADYGWKPALTEIYRDGELLTEVTFDEIRNRLWK